MQKIRWMSPAQHMFLDLPLFPLWSQIVPLPSSYCLTFGILYLVPYQLTWAIMSPAKELRWLLSILRFLLKKIVSLEYYTYEQFADFIHTVYCEIIYHFTIHQCGTPDHFHFTIHLNGTLDYWNDPVLECSVLISKTQ